MPEMTALILAAGRGIRMGPRGRLSPKGLLDIGGMPLVSRSVKLLQEKGIEQIRIVTGHLSEQYEAIFEGMGGVTLIHNAHFAETGSLRSLMMGLDGVDGPLLLLESDLIYERRALDPIRADVTRILLSGETLATDEVYVWPRSGRDGQPVLMTLNKDINALEPAHMGEHVGITCFAPDSLKELRRVGAAHLLEHPESDYEIVMVKTATSVDIDCHLTPDLAWSEVDDEPMYRHALEKVWPRIRENDVRYERDLRSAR